MVEVRGYSMRWHTPHHSGSDSGHRLTQSYYHLCPRYRVRFLWGRPTLEPEQVRPVSWRMLLCRPVARQKERLYQSKLPGAPRGLKNWGQNADNTPRIPGTVGHSANSLERARTWHLRSSWGSHSSPRRPTIWPRKGTEVRNRWHFVNFNCKP